MIYVLITGVLLGQLFFYVVKGYARRKGGLARALWRLFTGWRVRLNDKENLIIERKLRATRRAQIAMINDQDKIPLAIPEAWLARYPGAMFRPDPDDGVMEVDVKDWNVVRKLELNLYGCYWHTKAGEYLPAGITPVEEAAEARARSPRPLTAAERNEPAVLTANGWWEMKMAQMDEAESYSVQHLPSRANWEAIKTRAQEILLQGMKDADLEQQPEP